jgi:type II secretion system protein D
MTVSPRLNRAVVPQAVLWIAAAAICCGLAPERIANGQVPRTDDLKAYPLQHVRVTDIETTLSRLLPPGSEVAADAQTNQVWVRGSSQIHKIAQEIIGSLDTPARQPLPPPVEQSPATPLKSYPAQPGEAAALAARWNAEFGGMQGARIVADNRTSQVLVIAPPEVHAAIDRSLGSNPLTRPANTPTAQYPAPGQIARAAATQPAPQTPASGFREVPLRQNSAERVGQMLIEMLGQRLSPTATSIPGSAAFVLQLARGGTLTLTIDRQRQLVRIEGPQPAVASCVELVEMLDASRQSADDVTRLVAIHNTRPADLERTVNAIRAANAQASPGGDAQAARVANVGSLVSMLYQQTEPQEAAAAAAPGNAQAPAAGENGEMPPRPGMVVEITPEEGGGLIGPVQIEILDGMDTLVIRGHAQDVQRVIEMIRRIEELSVETEPAIEVHHLRHANCEAVTTLVQQLYTNVYAARRGTVSITALVKPNALLLIGRPESVDTVLNLVERLDRPVGPETQFRVFRLQHATAQTALTMIQEFYEEERGGMGTQVRLTADVRSNSLIVQAAPRDLLEVADMIARIDTPTNDAVNELRLFQLNNTLAAELAQTLSDAIGGAAGTATGGGAGEQRSTTLRFVTVDAEGRQQLSSGILSDVKITADTRANTLLVSAPAESMPLMEALIVQLDQLPAAEAQIKVFTIINSDAASLMDMLETLFGEQAGAGEPAVQTAAVEEESSLVQLRFAVDERTNSIIASGTVGDLSVVEAILLRLDETDVRKRKSTVYRLKNAPAEDVATAVNEYLTNERSVEQITTDLMSPFEQIEREVVVVAEPVSNSLIVSATPEYYEEIMVLVEKLDERPPMVMIQVLIAEVRLNDTDEFGVEIGLQDSVLFDRSLLGDIQTTTNSTQQSTPGGVTTVTEQIIRSATNTPGFLFNNQQLGNSGATGAMNGANTVGTQGLAHFDLGRINNDLGYGGLVLAASSNSVSMLLRALKEKRRLEVLSRPQIMTMDNQPAFILVGERVPRVTGTQSNEAGQTNVITLEDVGLILGVTPRISPDGLVVMEIDATNSALGPESEGIPISIAPNGDTIRSPRINTIQAQTTVSALNGQTVVLGGLITKSTNKVERRVPLLANIPVLGNLFRYDLKEGGRNELLIIMTPHIVENEEDAELVKQMEVARMHWCLTDVLELNGDGNLRGRSDEWGNAETHVVYPDGNPGDSVAPSLEDVPVPAPTPKGSPFLLDPAPVPEGGAGVPAAGNRKDVEQAAYTSTATVPSPSPPATVLR